MIYLASTFIDYKVASLSSLNEVGSVGGILIDPYRFAVAGFWVNSNYVKSKLNPVLLITQSIRQIDSQHILINDIDDFNQPKELPKLENILTIDYQIPGKKVISTEKQPLGKVEDFSFDDQDFKIMHISVKSLFWQRLKYSHKQYPRQQIETVDEQGIEVNIGPATQSMSSLSPAA